MLDHYNKLTEKEFCNMSNKTIVNSNDPNGYLLLPYDGPDAGYRVSILDRIRERLDESLDQHSHVLAVMLAIRFPQALSAELNNHCFQYFIEEYRRILNAHGYDPHYIWVAEKDASMNHHYHLLLLLNGSRIRYFQTPPEEASAVWSRALSRFYGYGGSMKGLIHVGEVMQNQFSCHGYVIPRDNPDMQKFALEHFSYFAKVHSKICFPDKVRSFGASLLKKEAHHDE